MNRIKELRKKTGLTLKQLGASIGLKDNTLSQYEKDKREPKLETWKKLAEYFGVSVGYLQGCEEIIIFTKAEKEEFDDLMIQFSNDKFTLIGFLAEQICPEYYPALYRKISSGSTISKKNENQFQLVKAILEPDLVKLAGDSK